MKRTELIEKANEIINGEREQQYGSPENNFKRIADLWSDYMGINFEAEHVAVMMILLKIARIASNQYKDDNWIDIIGYAACGGEIAGCNEGEAE